MPTLKLPDGPRSSPLLQTFQWLTAPLKFMETCEQHYGDIFTTRIGPLFTPQVFVSNPQAIQQIFATDPKILDSGEAAGIKSPLLGHQSMLALAGEQHKRHRRLLTPPFHGERMLAYGHLLRDITLAVTEQWTTGTPFSIHSSMQTISFEIILKAVFCLEHGSRYEKLKQVLFALLNPKRPLLTGMMAVFPFLQRDLGSWSPWRIFMNQIQQIDALIYAEIAERRAHGTSQDILSLMMSARDEQDQPMTDLELRDELITLLLAGHETTAIALSWAFYWIHYLPIVREKLQQELNTLGDNAERGNILRLPYLNAVCCETLRLYPVAMLALNRVVKLPLQIMDHQFQPRTLLVPCIYLTHQREDLYPNPKKFQPERFLERQFASYEYLPFGGSNRRCIGLAFAMFEMKVVLATVLSRWQLTLANNNELLPIRRGALLAPKDGVRMVVEGIYS